MATEGQSWDTSTAHIRKVLKECIELGREVHNNESFNALEDTEENPDMWVALRLLGSALHTLEDLLAHSESSLHIEGGRNTESTWPQVIGVK